MYDESDAPACPPRLIEKIYRAKRPARGEPAGPDRTAAGRAWPS